MSEFMKDKLGKIDLNTILLTPDFSKITRVFIAKRVIEVEPSS